MTHFLKNTTFSLRLVIVAIMFYAVDLTVKGGLYWRLNLQSNRIINEGEIWRIVTYPFVSPNIFSVSMFALVLMLFGKALEEIWQTRRLAAIFGTALLIQALLWIAMPFNNHSTTLSGAEMLTFFTLSNAFWLYPQRFITLWGRYAVHTQATIFALMMLSLGAIGYTAIIGDQATFLQGSFQSVIGVVAGLSATFIYQRSKAKMQVSDTKSPILSTQIVQDPEYHLTSWTTKPQPRILPSIEQFSDDYSDEDQLNAILDAILERGYESLLPEEKEFLNRYSQNIP